jgi:hypothetical protein
MADPITAPIDSHFLLRWTTDANVEMVNSFQIFDGTFEDHPGRKPRSTSKGKVKAVLTITKDGQPDGYRKGVPKPDDTEILMPTMKFVHEYTFIFVARKEGAYVFTITFTAEPLDRKNPPKIEPPPPLTKEVKVVPAVPVNRRRQDMLELIEKWFPSSVLGTQKVPPGSNQDILAMSGYDNKTPKTWTVPAHIPAGGTCETLVMTGKSKWTQSGYNISALGEGQTSAAKKSYNASVLPIRQAEWAKADPATRGDRPIKIPIDTSCINVMAHLVRMWSNGEFTCNLNTMTTANPAFYVKAADEYAKASPNEPKPGDIIFLVKDENRGFFQHTCILVSRSTELWRTADGGGGTLPDQTADWHDKPVGWTVARSGFPRVPMFQSPTDGQIKALHGWVDIDRVPNSKYNPDGSLK